MKSAARCSYLIRFRPQSEVSFSHLPRHRPYLCACVCLCVCVCVCVCVCACTLLLWRPSEGMSRSVSVCLCSPILSLALCDNRFYHTVHFCVFVCACACACVCWSVYAVQSLSSTVIFKVFVQRWRSDAI